MCNYVLKQLVLYQAMYVWTYCSERFVEIWEVRFTLRCQVLAQKDWKLSLEIVVSYQNICIFIKWKHVKYHAERSKYPFHPGVEIFSFQPEVKGTCISKKIHPGWISPRLRVICLYLCFFMLVDRYGWKFKKAYLHKPIKILHFFTPAWIQKCLT